MHAGTGQTTPRLAMFNLRQLATAGGSKPDPGAKVGVVSTEVGRGLEDESRAARQRLQDAENCVPVKIASQELLEVMQEAEQRVELGGLSAPEENPKLDAFASLAAAATSRMWLTEEYLVVHYGIEYGMPVACVLTPGDYVIQDIPITGGSRHTTALVAFPGGYLDALRSGLSHADILEEIRAMQTRETLSQLNADMELMEKSDTAAGKGKRTCSHHYSMADRDWVPLSCLPRHAYRIYPIPAATMATAVAPAFTPFDTVRPIWTRAIATLGAAVHAVVRGSLSAITLRQETAVNPEHHLPPPVSDPLNPHGEEVLFPVSGAGPAYQDDNAPVKETKTRIQVSLAENAATFRRQQARPRPTADAISDAFMHAGAKVMYAQASSVKALPLGVRMDTEPAPTGADPVKVYRMALETCLSALGSRQMSESRVGRLSATHHARQRRNRWAADIIAFLADVLTHYLQFQKTTMFNTNIKRLGLGALTFIARSTLGDDFVVGYVSAGVTHAEWTASREVDEDEARERAASRDRALASVGLPPPSRSPARRRARSACPGTPKSRGGGKADTPSAWEGAGYAAGDEEAPQMSAAEGEFAAWVGHALTGRKPKRAKGKRRKGAEGSSQPIRKGSVWTRETVLKFIRASAEPREYVVSSSPAKVLVPVTLGMFVSTIDDPWEAEVAANGTPRSAPSHQAAEAILTVFKETRSAQTRLRSEMTVTPGGGPSVAVPIVATPVSKFDEMLVTLADTVRDTYTALHRVVMRHPLAQSAAIDLVQKLGVSDNAEIQNMIVDAILAARGMPKQEAPPTTAVDGPDNPTREQIFAQVLAHAKEAEQRARVKRAHVERPMATKRRRRVQGGSSAKRRRVAKSDPSSTST